MILLKLVKNGVIPCVVLTGFDSNWCWRSSNKHDRFQTKFNKYLFYVIVL